MAPLPPVPQVLRVAFSGTYYGARWANVMHVRYSGTRPFPADLDTFCSDMGTAYDGHLLEHISDGVTLTDIDAVDLTDSLGAVGHHSGSYPGDVAGDSLTASVAVCLSWKISRRYRGGHPRTYLCGIPDSVTANVQQLSAGAVTNYLSDATGFMNAVNAIVLGGATVSLGCVHYVRNGSPLSPGEFDTIQSAAVHPRLDSQRRRTGKE
jgi:hypothetical protein